MQILDENRIPKLPGIICRFSVFEEFLQGRNHSLIEHMDELGKSIFIESILKYCFCQGYNTTVVGESLKQLGFEVEYIDSVIAILGWGTKIPSETDMKRIFKFKSKNYNKMIAQIIHEKHNVYWDCGNKLMLYFEGHHYRADNSDFAQVKRWIDDEISLYLDNPKKSNREEVLEYFRILFPKELHEFDRNRDLIPFKNGVYHRRNQKFRPGKPDDFLFAGLDCNYIPGIVERPVSWVRFLKSTEWEQSMWILFEACIRDAILGFQAQAKKFIILYGKSNSGKSKILQFIMTICGESGKVITSFNQIEYAFQDYELVGKRFVYIDDAQSKQMSDGVYEKIKLWSGDSPFSAWKKYGGQFTLECKFGLWMSCNDLPGLPEKANKESLNTRFRFFYFSKGYKASSSNDILTPMLNDRDQLVSFLVDNNRETSIADMADLDEKEFWLHYTQFCPQYVNDQKPDLIELDLKKYFDEDKKRVSKFRKGK